MRYSERDVKRIEELQEAAERYRYGLMRAIACNKQGVPNAYCHEELEQLGRKARAAQSEIEEIHLANRRRERSMSECPFDISTSPT